MDSGMTSEIANWNLPVVCAYSFMVSGRILWTLLIPKNIAPIHPRDK